PMKSRILISTAVLAGAMALASCGGSGGPAASDDETPSAKRTPNILFVIMDDVGVDQMPSMGYGGVEAPAMPSIDALANTGVRFRNTWSLPEGSPGRSALMPGRYPLRNDIFQAIGPNDLANSQVSPWEPTVAKLVHSAGYESAMFGKFHLAGPEHNQAENATP